MKIRNILFTFIAIFAAAGIFSCQKVDDEAFDKSATERLEQRVEEIREILTDQENGWVMKYYIGASQSGGGYTYTMKFTDADAEIGFEYAKTAFGYEADATITSLYKIADDNGPVLSFDTYNDFIHYFSTPSSSNYQAMGGDFEFEIREASPEMIVMIGRRSRNIITLEPLSKTASDYVTGVVELSNNFIPYYLDGSIGSVTVKGTVDYAYRQINLVADGKEISSAFCFTDKGIELYRPVELGGVQLKEMAYDKATLKLTASSVDLQGSVPSDWIPYVNYEGSYELYYANGFTADVKLVQDVYNSTYRMTGLNSNFELVLQYNMQTGKLVLNSQLIGNAEGYPIYFCAWALDSGGSVTWAPNAGMHTVWNGDAENPVYTFESNGYTWRTASGDKCMTDSFILFAIGDDIFYFDRAAWGTNGYAQWPYFESLTKK